MIVDLLEIVDKLTVIPKWKHDRRILNRTDKKHRCGERSA
jgi:hypothetical protein